MKLPWLRRPTDDEMLVGAVRAKVDMASGNINLRSLFKARVVHAAFEVARKTAP